MHINKRAHIMYFMSPEEKKKYKEAMLKVMKGRKKNSNFFDRENIEDACNNKTENQ